jgi:hypothetical protein
MKWGTILLWPNLLFLAAQKVKPLLQTVPVILQKSEWPVSVSAITPLKSFVLTRAQDVPLVKKFQQRIANFLFFRIRLYK